MDIHQTRTFVARCAERNRMTEREVREVIRSLFPVRRVWTLTDEQAKVIVCELSRRGRTV